ncbi:hypothetical protein Taro_006187 [Colocasia esculenta]|uniref:Uncharacterized protein n=1 Tax=Colocasia esculenta TaxID=4460 RepID=A0A843TRQ1_COLES|nr:hypothetical protein [Colocasia esculenta]
MDIGGICVAGPSNRPSCSHAPPSPPAETASTSVTQTVNGSHQFKITGYSLSKGLGIGKYIASDTFQVGGYSWAIYFYPDGKSPEDNAVYVSLFIALASEGTDVRALFELTLMDQSGKERHKVHSHFRRNLEGGPYTLKYRGSMCGGMTDSCTAFDGAQPSPAGELSRVAPFMATITARAGELSNNALAITDCRGDDYRSDGSSVARPPFNVIREYHFGACRAQRHQVGYSHVERSSWPSFERWPVAFNTFELSDHTHSIAYGCRFEKGRRLVFCVVGLAWILAMDGRVGRLRSESADSESGGIITLSCLGVTDLPTKLFQVVSLPDLPINFSLVDVLLLESGKAADVSFEVDDEIFHAHKLVLATRSPVFRAQLFGPMKDQNTECIKVEDMEAPVFKNIVFCVIERYAVSLASVLERIISVMQTDGFEYLKVSCPSLLTEILEYVAKIGEHSALACAHPNDALDGSDALGRRVKQRI